jgi:hypothetical protein
MEMKNITLYENFEIVDMLRSASKQYGNKGDDVIIPEHDPGSGETYPMGIKPGTYSKKEVSDALQFLADMME